MLPPVRVSFEKDGVIYTDDYPPAGGDPVRRAWDATTLILDHVQNLATPRWRRWARRFTSPTARRAAKVRRAQRAVTISAKRAALRDGDGSTP